MQTDTTPLVTLDLAHTLHYNREDSRVRLEWIGPNENNDSGWSSKFWQATRRSDGQWEIRWGRVGSQGQGTIKNFEYVTKKCSEKLRNPRKSYSYVTGTAETMSQIRDRKVQVNLNTVRVPREVSVRLTGPYGMIEVVVRMNGEWRAYDDNGNFLMPLSDGAIRDIKQMAC